MKPHKKWIMAIACALCMGGTVWCYAAYTHQNEIDSPYLRAAHPQTIGTKLDSCTVCHKGGSNVSGGKTTLGSCQWCHYTSEYGRKEDYDYSQTLNTYGLDYLQSGRDEAALTLIQEFDSDGDGFSNKMEIAALRYPGDANDDPTKVSAPSKIFTRDQLETMPQHTQFLLLNASKSTDTYVEYAGLPLETLLKPLALASAENATVLSPDGFAQTHPFDPDPTLNVYHVNGIYPPATFHYDPQADVGVNPGTGWCDYAAPSVTGRNNGDPIMNAAGLKMILAIRREGSHLTPGVLNAQNKLDGEGPFRLVPPQKSAGAPDQRSTAANATNPDAWIWPYNPDGDHNAGASTRSTTIIKVGPLPEGTTDIDHLEAGWNYIDQNKIVVYGAIDPSETIEVKIVQLLAAVDAIPPGSFMPRCGQAVLKQKIEAVRKLIKKGGYKKASEKLQDDILAKLNGCQASSLPDRNDWLRDCEAQAQLYWAVNEIMVLLKIML
jgi:hypothetical protein